MIVAVDPRIADTMSGSSIGVETMASSMLFLIEAVTRRGQAIEGNFFMQVLQCRYEFGARKGCVMSTSDSDHANANVRGVVV